MHRNEIIEVEITGYAFGGNGIAKVPTENGDFVVFVENTFPGQIVQARVDKKRKKHAECKLVQILRRSPLEQVTEFQEISGAPYIYVPVESQQKYKQSSTLDIFKKIGRVEEVDTLFDTYISSPIPYFYRNKMEYSFSSIEHDLESNEEKDNAFALGFKRRGTWWKVESLNRQSGLFDDEFESKLKDIRIYLEKTGLAAWHPPKKTGFFRHIVVRKSFYQDQLLINLVTSSDGLDQFNIKEFSTFLVNLLGERLAGFQHTINDNVADRAKIENGTNQLHYGESKVVEQLSGLFFEISMESFFQTNPKSAELLYQKALDYVFEENDLKSKVVMDLFCGTGTIGQILAKRENSAQIIGVDIVEEAIMDAKKNAERNEIKSVNFYSADVGKFLSQYPEYKGKIGTIVLDPPRAGIAPKTLRKVIELNADRIVYISCNPSTQARDTETLQNAGYKLEKLSLVDQFLHTSHIESIAKFIKAPNFIPLIED